MKNYKNMNNEEIKEQLEWSDQYEFSYGYSMWAFKEIERLNNIINELEKWLEKEIEDDSGVVVGIIYKRVKGVINELKGE